MFIWFQRNLCLLIITGFFISCGKTTTPPIPHFPIGSEYPNICGTDKGFIMIWYEGDKHLVMSEFTGENWIPKDTVVSSERFFKNWADLPQIFHIGGDTIALSWLEMSGEKTYDYNVKVAMSVDRGKTWSDPVIPHRDGTKGEHGFVSFFKYLGKTGIIWLDSRAIMANDYNLSPKGMRLYMSTINSSGNLGPEIMLDDMVCECCPTSAVNTIEGPLIAYRDRSIDEVRNIQLSLINDTRLQYPVSEDGWIIPGCPVNGPKMAVNGDKVAIVWYTAPNYESKVNMAFSKDGGLSFGTPIKIDNGYAIGRVDVIWLDKENVIVSWIEDKSGNGELILKSLNAEYGSVLFQTSFPINSGRGSGYPKLAKTNDQIFITWTKTGKKTVIRSEWIPVNKIFQ